MKVGAESRKQTIVAAVLGGLLLLIVVYQFMPSSSTIASTTTATTAAETGLKLSPSASHPARRITGPASGKKERTPQNLDPTLHLAQLAASEQITYEGSGRNIFVSQADPVIPTALSNGTTDKDKKVDQTYQPPAVTAPPPIPLKFFGFASRPGEPKKIFLSKGDDVFIAGEGEIVDRRYKVMKISATSVDIQDVVGSGPLQSIPLTLGNPS